MYAPASDFFHRLLHVPEQSRSAKTVELFGWLMMIESPFMLVAPHSVASFLGLPELGDQGAIYLRLSGGLLCVIGMLYVGCARLNSWSLVFISMLDRPLVPVVMAIMWWRGLIPGPIALWFSIQDFGSFLWTLQTWRSESRAVIENPGTPSTV